jgi:hypothetical protein
MKPDRPISLVQGRKKMFKIAKVCRAGLDQDCIKLAPDGRLSQAAPGRYGALGSAAIKGTGYVRFRPS